MRTDAYQHLGNGDDDLAELGHAEAGARAPLNPGANGPAGSRTAPLRSRTWPRSERLSYRSSISAGSARNVPAGTPSTSSSSWLYVARAERSGVFHQCSNRFRRGHLGFRPDTILGMALMRRYSATIGPHLLGLLVYSPARLRSERGGRHVPLRVSAATIPGGSRTWRRPTSALAASMPFLRNNLVYYLKPCAIRRYEAKTRPSYDASRVPVYVESDLSQTVRCSASVERRRRLRPAAGARQMVSGRRSGTWRSCATCRTNCRPSPASSRWNGRRRCRTSTCAPCRTACRTPTSPMPSTIPEIAGSRSASTCATEVSADGNGSYSVTETTAERRWREHHAARRPRRAQTPARDLSATTYRDLDAIGFADADAFGVKAANLAVLRTLGLADVDVPDGYALPFYFYHEFMRHNGFYADVDALLADAGFRGRHRRRATPRCAACASASPTAPCRSGCARRWRPCRDCSRRVRRSAAGRAPTTRTCRGSAARGCTTR